MAQLDNIQIVRHIFEAWNKHDVEQYVKLLDEKYVVESNTLPAPLTGQAAGRQFMQMYVSASPDLHFDRDQIFGEGDHFATRRTATGTQRGELMGIKLMNRRTVTHGCSVG